MDSSLVLFADALRRHGVRVSTAEVIDAMRCAAQPGALANSERLSAALRCALITRPSDVATFDALFALFFALRRIPQPGELADGQSLQGWAEEQEQAGATDSDDSFELVDGTQGTEEISGSPSAEADMGEYFDPDSLRDGRNLDADADIVDLAAMSDEVSFSPSGAASRGRGMKVQLDVSRGRGAPGTLTPATGTAIDLELTDAEEDRLLSWLGASRPADSSTADDDEALRGLLDRLPQHLAEHLRRLSELRRTTAIEDAAPVVIDHVAEAERERLTDTLRRLAASLDGGLSPKRRTDPHGRIDAARTARRSLRYDGVPFAPITLARVRERARVLVLADVSLSVRATARFTLHVVHGMQAIFGHARTFAFVDEVAEITRLFERHPIEHALGLVFGNQIVDTEANSDYGAVLEQFLDECGSAINRRTSVIILGDGRSNGKDPRPDALAEIARRARHTVWLTPEPSYSWHLGSCAMGEYARIVDRVHVVNDLSGLERSSTDLAVNL